MKKYRVWAHSGLAWLLDLGEFDDYGEASNALYNEYVQQTESVDAEDIESFCERFFFDSRIEEINE